MPTLIIMPKQGQSVESCIISEIKKKKGDIVKKGDILFSYETDKASFEEESPVDGVVLEVFYNDGDEVEVLKNMMIIGEEGEDYAGLLTEVSTGISKVEEDIKVPDATPSVSQPLTSDHQPFNTQSSHQTMISPRARALADKEVVDLMQIIGAGPQGRIIERDIQAYLEQRPKKTGLAKKIMSEGGVTAGAIGSGLAGSVKSTDLSDAVNTPVSVNPGVDYVDQKLSNMRKIIAKAMHASLQNSAQLTHHLGADARRLLVGRKSAKLAFESGKTSINITLNDMICFAVIKALKKFPNVNSHFLGDSMRLFNKVNLGLAVDTERGLMVPAIQNADDLSLEGLAGQLKQAAANCKKGTVSPDLLSPEAATFTVSNLGNYGVEMFTPVINLPQTAILGVNTIVPRPKDLGDGVYAFVPYIGLSLTYDHRALDGGEATRFLKQVAVEIETM